MTARFNAAPGWPLPPEGWVPPKGWVHPLDWPLSPPGWPFWVDDVTGEPVADQTAGRPWFKRKRVLIPSGVFAFLLVAGMAGAGESEPSEVSVPSPTPSVSGGAVAEAEASAAADAEAEEAEASAEAVAAAEAAAEQAAAEAAAVEAAAVLAAAEEAAAVQAAADAAARAAAVWTVTGIVDGDTIDVQQGGVTERVRVIGIDTPERGECGYDQSAAALAAHVLGQPVVLSAGARDDRDRYDRVLRYVDRETDNLDAGLALIGSGQAIARYDSRDGYGGHPREGAYITADDASPVAAEVAACAAPPPAPVAPVPAPAPPPAPAPAPVAPPADVYYENCDAVRAAGAAPIRVGQPGYAKHLDRDGDGQGCGAD